MAKRKQLPDMTYQEREQVLIEKVHAYRTLQIEHAANDYHLSFMDKLYSARVQISYCLSFMNNQGGPGSLEELAREQKQKEAEFLQVKSSATSRNFLVQKKYTQAIRDALDAKLEELGSPVIKPQDYH